MTSLLDALREKKLVSSEQIEDAEIKHLGAQRPVHDLLVEMGYLKEEDLLGVIGEMFHLPVVALGVEKISMEAIKVLSFDQVKRYGVMPVRVEDNKLIVAMSNPQDVSAIEDLGAITGLMVKPVLAKKSDIAECIEKHYLLDDSIYDLMKNMVGEVKVELIKEGKENQNFLDIDALKGDKSPVVRLVNLILSDAVKARASDIHIEPYEDFVEVRYRLDGFLKNIMKVPKKMHAPLAVRIKILSEMDISETRQPQDGRCSIMIDERKIDLRISVVPTFHGEKIVLRLLDKSQEKKYIDHIGFHEDDLVIFKETIQRPQGMVLVTGPTGSGKTSTLYAALGFIKNETKNIVTIEDPVEYVTEGVNQIQVNPVKNVTFASGLRSILRQDPNVILVGEIRDLETAQIAFRAALTGHMVFSTLHTNSAISTIIRLRDLGLEPYLIGSSVQLIIAQRLVRKICPSCRQEIENAEELRDINQKYERFIQKHEIKKFFKGTGCEACHYTGFLDRTAIYEMLVINDRLKKLISEQAAQDALIRAAEESHFKTLLDAGVDKIKNALTTIEEVERVCGLSQCDERTVEPIERNSSSIEKTNSCDVQQMTEALRMAVNKRFTVLIVDDEPDIRIVLRACLENYGYAVIEAEDGEQGVRKAHQQRPDLIIMDVMMPKVDGLSAIKKIRQDLETASIPVVMLTAKTDKVSEIRALDAGADDYISKPFDRDKLLARIRMLLKRQ